MQGQRRIIIIDFEKDRVAVGFERAKVMFFVWVVGVAKVVVHFDGRDDARDRLRAEGGHACRHDRMTEAEVVPQFIVERANPRSLGESFVATDRTQFARGRALKLAQVTRSLYVSKTRSSDQRAIWREIDAKSQRMNVASPTAAMSAIYEDNQTKLDDFVRAMPRNDRQVGAVFSTGDKVVGLDAFDSADTFFKAAPKIVRSYAVDALEGPAEASATESANNLVRSFLNDIVTMDHLTRFKALGLGDDLRFNGSNVAGAALEISGQIVHIVSFPRTLYEGDGEHHPRSAYMMSARMRRTFH